VRQRSSTDIRDTFKNNIVAEDIIMYRNKWKDRVIGMDEGSWQKIGWNCKSIGRIVRGRARSC
jgi:hypothetical protein